MRNRLHEVTLYTQPDCHACALVKEWLTARGVAFAERDIRTDVEAMAAVRAIGALSTPVTVIGDTAVIGFNHRKLASLLDRRGNEDAGESERAMATQHPISRRAGGPDTGPPCA